MNENIAREVEYADILVGDTLAILYEDTLFNNVEVEYHTETYFAAGGYGFNPNWGCRYFLIERPKSLPTKLGSVVKAVGVEWVLCDPDNADPWFSPEAQTWLSNEDFAGIDWEEVV